MSSGMQAEISGAEVFALVKELEPILAQKDRFLVMMSALTVAFVAQNPSIETGKLIEGVKGASEWMAAFMAEAPDAGVN